MFNFPPQSAAMINVGQKKQRRTAGVGFCARLAKLKQTRETFGYVRGPQMFPGEDLRDRI